MTCSKSKHVFGGFLSKQVFGGQNKFLEKSKQGFGGLLSKNKWWTYNCNIHYLHKINSVSRTHL